MSSDSGARKRNTQNKKKKGSAGNISAGGISIREVAASKSSPDELIHIQKDVKFGDNWCQISVFVVISIALVGALGLYISADHDSGLGKSEEPATFDWLAALKHMGKFYIDELSNEKTIDEEPSVDTQIEPSYLDLLWSYYPFGQKDEQLSEASLETTEQDDEVFKESENEKDSREDYSKESADDDKLENGIDDDENDRDDRESEENLDDDKSTDGEDDEKDNDNDDDDEQKEDDDDQKDNDDESNSVDDSENLYEPYKSYNYQSYRKQDEEDELQKDTKDDEESSDESKEQVDRRDQRFNYYHKRDSEEVQKYDHIKEEDDPNDSSEHEGGEKFDSEENTKLENDEDTQILEDISHSSEEGEQQDEFPELKEPLVEPDLKPENDPPESGNLVTKLSVGIALIFVAYSVIIRKWNNYVNREANEAEVIFGVASENDEDLVDIAQTIAENLIDSMNDSNSFVDPSEAERKTLQDYLETPSNSANEQSEDDSVDENAAEDNLPVDSENSQTASETEGETDEDFEYGEGNYDRLNITNQDDWRVRHQLDDADEDWENRRRINATLKYYIILDREPRSIRARYGLVRAYDSMSDDKKSNVFLRRVIKLYKNLLNKPHVPEALKKMIAERTVDRMKFLGTYDEAIRLLKMLVEKYPEEISYQIELAITYLIIDRLLHAEILLGKVIQKDPNNGLALVNYGFIMKQKGELEKAVKVLSKGISSGEKGTQDSKFYYHLGEALQRLGRRDEALKVFKEAAEKGIFDSKYQRSLYNENGLVAQPWWNPAAIPEYKDFFLSLEQNWKKIRDEVKPMLVKEKHRLFQNEAEQLREKGEWKQLELFSRGVERPTCKEFPFTCSLIRGFAPAARCRRGQVKFSIIEPGTHVWPHCGPTNCRLRAHLGLIVPKNVTIRVAEATKSWREGKVLLFDDSFEHEVWHNGTSSRLVLIVDVWHPSLSEFRRDRLSYL